MKRISYEGFSRNGLRETLQRLEHDDSQPELDGQPQNRGRRSMPGIGVTRRRVLLKSGHFAGVNRGLESLEASRIPSVLKGHSFSQSQ
jgi:hypothetical protein